MCFVTFRVISTAATDTVSSSYYYLSLSWPVMVAAGLVVAIE